MSQREVDNYKCENTIEKYHKVINEAKKLYEASEKVIDEKVSVEILEEALYKLELLEKVRLSGSKFEKEYIYKNDGK